MLHTFILCWVISAVYAGNVMIIDGRTGVSRMDEALTWLRWLTPEERLLVWLRAENTGWKQICWKMGCSRTTAWRNWVFALQKMALMLNETKVPVCTATQKEQPDA